MPNPFVHVELNTPEPQLAKEFYSKLFQWNLEEMPNPGGSPAGAYTLVRVGDGTGGGIMKQVPGGPSGWLPYIAVQDVQVSTEKARSLGAHIMKGVTEVPQMGWFSIIRDPAGATFGLWQSKSM